MHRQDIGLEFKYLLSLGLFLAWGVILFGQETTTDQPDKQYCDSLGNYHIKLFDFGKESLEDNLVNAQKALEYFACSENWELYVGAYNNISALYFIHQRYDSYIQSAQKSAEVANQKLSPDNQVHEIALSNAAISKAVQGNFQQCIQELQELFNYWGDCLESTEVADYYLNIGSFYKELGDYDEARPYFIQSIDLREEIGKTKNYKYPTAIAELAHSYKFIGELDTALHYYHACLTKADQIDNENLQNKSLSQVYLYC